MWPSTCWGWRTEILGVDLEDEVLRKVQINQNRRYVAENGVLRRVEEQT